MKEVIFMEPVYKDYIWGGNRLKKKFNKNTPYERTAESWEISANKNGKSIIKNGKFKGKTLDEIFNNEELKEKIFGKKALNLLEFPILIKFIDANNKLSVQVHPDDEYARKYENSQGKAEVWYIIDCKKDAKLVCGLKNETSNLVESIKPENIEKNLNFIDVKKGDSIYIESGTVHAILDGILICEIQQNSDLTYRLYDWNRIDKNGKPRKLHIDKSLDVINMNNKVEIRHKDNTKTVQNIVANNKFSTDLIKVDKKYEDKTNLTSFYAYNVIDGKGILEIGDNQYNLSFGDSFIVPASVGEYCIKGNLELLKTFI